VNGEPGSAESTEVTGNDRHPLAGDAKPSAIDIYKASKFESFFSDT